MQQTFIDSALWHFYTFINEILFYTINSKKNSIGVSKYISIYNIYTFSDNNSLIIA